MMCAITRERLAKEFDKIKKKKWILLGIRKLILEKFNYPFVKWNLCVTNNCKKSKKSIRNFNSFIKYSMKFQVFISQA